MSRRSPLPRLPVVPSAQVTRRAWIATAAGCLVVGCGHGRRFETRRVEVENDVVTLHLGDHPELLSPGSMIAIAPRGHRDPILIERLQGERFVVMSLRCPHLGCTVRWDPEEQLLRCPCHGSRFDDTGRVLQGPAKQGLTHYRHAFSPIDLQLRIDLSRRT